MERSKVPKIERNKHVQQWIDDDDDDGNNNNNKDNNSSE